MINLKNVSYQYRRGVPILENITANLKPGHIYGLLGLNGVGKTTLLKNIGGLLFPSSGAIEMTGFEPHKREVDFLSNIYFVTDHAELPEWKIRQFQEVYGSLYPKFDVGYFENLLGIFQIDCTKNIKDLSFGQVKKVNIAFALATNANVILMDEPTNGLDIPSKTQFRKIIARYVTDERLLIISTHQIRDIHNLIDHLLVLNHSRLILDESLHSLQQSFYMSTQPSDVADAIYSEQSIHGTLSLIPNVKNEESQFDIEFFFNALSADPNLVNHFKPTQTNL
ncbi:ABC transporter ATP-binding protein [Sphingobacterium sp. lm-10]|uniref:ABC transporter ATP-binding protein n=1 Tax=Sphingobacterium sp. lm-10 TaxID=2944904 RepID=UPI0020225BD1|nr:ABC transporter ATP-binding protein [Sphingobacterium sp. lm-10]MCL7987443.1 ABC transporter ATP-binding protein [Sphingobacterium sp. lm-10]